MEGLPDHHCPCYVDAAALMSRVRQGDTRQCLQVCKSIFLQSVSTDWTETHGWKEGCQNLTSKAALYEFWQLYWCDSTFCGVAISPTGGLEQDPNVDLIINTCQNIGITSVLDPGPPTSGFSCQTDAKEASQCPNAHGLSGTLLANTKASEGNPFSQTQTETPKTLLSSKPKQLSSTLPTTVTAPLTTRHYIPSTLTPEPTTLITATSLLPQTLVVVESSTTPTVLGASATSAGNSTTSSSGLSGAAKAAMAVCSVVGLVALIFLSALCLRRRQRKRQQLHRHRRLRSPSRLARDGPRPNSPRSLLISPSSYAADNNSPPLTPPLRLRDRKFLPSILRSSSNRSPSPPLTPLTPAYSSTHNSAVFPASPLCSPTTSKLVPRAEGRTALRTYGDDVHPQISLAMPNGGTIGHGRHVSRGSLGSSSVAPSSTTGPSSLRNEVHATNFNYFTRSTPPPPPPPTASPTRPPRPQEAPLEIPDLVSPAPSPYTMAAASPVGPPPSRALPSPPVSPVTSVGGSSTVRSQTRAVLSHHEARDLEDLAEEYPRSSWGSWSGTGTGSGAGSTTTTTAGGSKVALVLPSSPTKKSRNSSARSDSTKIQTPPSRSSQFYTILECLPRERLAGEDDSTDAYPLDAQHDPNSSSVLAWNLTTHEGHCSLAKESLIFPSSPLSTGRSTYHAANAVAPDCHPPQTRPCGHGYTHRPAAACSPGKWTRQHGVAVSQEGRKCGLAGPGIAAGASA
ncbi:hypothetical protein B0H63DRAFT_558501 [Podospora didyma]|uniref:Uncharacterized protein n=1 Tax=Podospora didyma TaxID=330526 RepID=A0AAE0NSM7_9PEZI|nr:hypothetical protein B0H63DRAFT_558501 [Podospora didyma]